MIALEQQQIDEHFMERALELARCAYDLNEVPVGALLVRDNKVLAAAHNRCVLDSDPCAHAEVLAIRNAAQCVNDCRLDNATLYVTLEPCLMCCGAILQARIARLVYSAREPRTGAVVSVHDSLRLPGVNHHVAISEGIKAIDSETLLKTFFKSKR